MLLNARIGVDGMSDTPRTDAEEDALYEQAPTAAYACVRADFARQLERELAVAHERIKFEIEVKEDAYKRIAELERALPPAEKLRWLADWQRGRRTRNG